MLKDGVNVAKTDIWRWRGAAQPAVVQLQFKLAAAHSSGQFLTMKEWLTGRGRSLGEELAFYDGSPRNDCAFSSPLEFYLLSPST